MKQWLLVIREALLPAPNNEFEILVADPFK